jgi:hypothetical protein
MNIETQVVNRELSEALKKAGYPQKGYFWWVGYDPEGNYNEGSPYLSYSIQDTKAKEILDTPFIFVAPIATEIAEVLSRIEYESSGGFPAFMIFRNPIGGDWLCSFRNPPLDWVDKGSQEAGRDKTMANALAKLYIFLKKNNLIKEETNGQRS